VYSVPVSGGRPTLLLRVRRQLAEPAFAADGKTLLFLRAGASAVAPFRLVAWRRGGVPSVVGTRSWTLTSPGVAWSQRRDRAAVSTARGIELVDPAGHARLVVAGTFDAPTWSADGSTLAFSGRRKRADGLYVSDVWTVRPDGRGLRRVLTDPAPVYGESLSPDGTRLALSLRGKAELLDLRTRRLRALPIATKSYAGFAWSPDGRLLAHLGADGLRVLDLASGRDRLVAPRGFDGVFSPDGRRIVFLRLHTRP
jgi:dipeptidyl aminopeptidase/acylaminoacyl peptidase